MYTNFTDAKMSFAFFGNSVKICGGKRENHGMFQVELDDQTYDPQNGLASSPGSFQQELFSKDGLKDGLHVVTIKNLEAGKYLDVDFVRELASNTGLVGSIHQIFHRLPGSQP